MDFSDFQNSKKILKRDPSRLYFEDEDADRFSIDSDGALTFSGQEILCSSQCEWLIIYDGGVYIEKLNDGNFILAIENHSWHSDSLARLERVLFDWSNDD